MTSQPINTSIVCHYVNMLISVTYYKKFDSDCQSHSDDSINLKGLSVLKNISFLFISRSFFIRTISIQFIVSLLPIYRKDAKQRKYSKTNQII